MDKHMPTPLSLSHYEGGLLDGLNCIKDAGSKDIAVLYCDEGTAAFIVRACNGVDTVLKTGDALLEKIGAVVGIEAERKAFIQALRAIAND